MLWKLCVYGATILLVLVGQIRRGVGEELMSNPTTEFVTASVAIVVLPHLITRHGPRLACLGTLAPR